MDREVVIVGVGESRAVGDVPGSTSLGLHAEAALDALRDAGLGKADVDAVFTNDSYVDPRVRHATAFAEYLGVPAGARLIRTIGMGSGASSGLFVHDAAAAIASGQCDVALAVSGDNLLTGLSRNHAVKALSDNRDAEFEVPFGPTLPACFGLVARRHMHEYGTTPEQLASVAVTMRAHAARNPRAHMRTPIGVDDVLSSRMIADPFTLLMCSLVSDGAAALVLTTRQRARDLPSVPVEVLGTDVVYGSEGDLRTHDALSQAGDLLRIGTREAARRALGQAGLVHQDVDLLMAYDCFAIMPILFVEAAGFCGPGEGGAFFAEGHGGPGGRLPVNTHGGMMSYAHPGNPGGLFMFPEAVRQLRGETGDRQVQGAEVAMVTGYGGQMAFWPVTILGRGR